MAGEDSVMGEDSVVGEAGKMRIRLHVGDVDIDDSMVVNPYDYIPEGEYNPHNVRPFIIGHEFGAFAIVFAACDQDAIDEVIDAGKMDSMKVSAEDLESMEEGEIEELLCGGNAGEYFHQDYLWMADIKNPPFSFIALLRASGLEAED